MGERYRPLFKLDAGGMAEVYVAEAESVAGFKKKVAIKRILPGLIKDERFVRMFLDEARLTLFLSHANIVNVFDIGKSDNAYFIVMEYVEGTNLKGLLEFTRKRSGSAQIPIHIAIWILNEVLKGLDYAHRIHDPETGAPLGIVHRDISPPNILMSWNGEVKLSDFGLAKATTQLEATDPGVVKGKFSYLSPEAAHGLEVDHRSDIFAMGILGFEMLTGSRLFLGETDYQTVESVRKADIPSMVRLNPQIDEELARIILKALARDPDHRYQSAGEFADDLLALLFSRGLKVSARDLTKLLESMRAEESAPISSKKIAKPEGSNLIMNLIDDELGHFRSLGEDDPDSRAASTGAFPLDALVGDAGSMGYDPAAPLSLDAFGVSDKGSHATTPDESSRRVTERDTGGTSASPRVLPQVGLPRAPLPASRGRSPWPIVLWVLVAALAAGGAAYYFMFMQAP